MKQMPIGATSFVFKVDTMSVSSPIDEAERTCYCSNSYTGDEMTVPLDSIDLDISK